MTARGFFKTVNCAPSVALAATLAIVRCRSMAAAEPLKASPPNPGPQPASSRVVVVRDPAATELFQPRPEHIRGMVDRGLTNLTGKTSVSAAWLSLVQPTDVVGLKVFSTPGATSGTRPAVVAAIGEGLLDAGLAPSNIVIWDKQTTDLRLAGYFDLGRRYGVRVAASSQAGYDEKEFYDTALLGNLVWGDLEFGRKGERVGRRSFVSLLVTKELTKIINVTPLLNNNLTGVAGNLYSLAFGSVDNLLRFESAPERLATAVPEIYALPALGDKVILNIVDALICQYEGGERSLLHYSATLNEVRLSRDPVALDALSLADLEKQRKQGKAPEIKPNLELYQNAALLELGNYDLKRITVETIRVAD